MTSTPFYLLIFACNFLLSGSVMGTTLFDSKRGQSAPTAAQERSLREQEGLARPTIVEDQLQSIRLDGVLVLGRMKRVLLTGPKGESYRFVWEGDLSRVLPFEGENAEQLRGYGLASAGSRSVWLQLPQGAQCSVAPDNGVVDCRDGQAELAMIKRKPLPAPPQARTVQGRAQPAGNPFQRLRPRPAQPSVKTKTRSQAFLDAEALKERFKEAARRQREEKIINEGKTAPPGFKANQPLFGKSSLVEDKGAIKPVTKSVSPAVARANSLKEQYRKQNQQLLQQGYKRSFGLGQLPDKAD